MALNCQPSTHAADTHTHSAWACSPWCPTLHVVPIRPQRSFFPSCRNTTISTMEPSLILARHRSRSYILQTKFCFYWYTGWFLENQIPSWPYSTVFKCCAEGIQILHGHLWFEYQPWLLKKHQRLCVPRILTGMKKRRKRALWHDLTFLGVALFLSVASACTFWQQNTERKQNKYWWRYASASVFSC